MESTKNWTYVTCDNNVSLHDNDLSSAYYENEDLILQFDDGYDIYSEHSCNNTGRHKHTTKAIIILKNAKYISCTLDDELDCNIKLDDIIKEGFEMLSYRIELNDNLIDINGLSYNKSLNSTFCNLKFSCTNVIYCFNDFDDDAWFQDWPTE